MYVFALFRLGFANHLYNHRTPEMALPFRAAESSSQGRILGKAELISSSCFVIPRDVLVLISTLATTLVNIRQP